MHPGNIRTFFQGRPLAGTGVGAQRGAGGGQATALAARMVARARANASGAGELQLRTGALRDSVVPIIRTDVRTDATVVGVGTTVDYGAALEIGAEPHPITAWGRPGIYVEHPGNKAYFWLSDAVRSVMPGRVVTVRTLF